MPQKGWTAACQLRAGDILVTVNGEYVKGSRCGFDAYGEVLWDTTYINGIGRTRNKYTYDSSSGTLTGRMVTGKTGSYTVNESIDYDALLRKTDDGISLSNGNTTILPYNKQYVYTGNDNTVASVSFQKNGTGNTFSYTYDTFGNITAVYENNVLQASYEYDELGQLIRENNVPANKTWVYTYDTKGNILSKTTYAYTTGTLGTVQDTDSYEYPPSQYNVWKDLLIRYNGGFNVYDVIGNPTTYDNGDLYDLTWSDGRKLTGGTKGSASFSYTYNSDGLRTQKTVGSKVYDYYWDGGKLAAMTVTSGNTVTTMRFLYNASGEPLALNYNGTVYLYETNLQGDVTGLINRYGRVAYYKYDAWGNVVDTDAASSNELLALEANPLRYRGYIYDTETGFYYLQSRYYDPTIGRFINADGYVNANGNLVGYNMFAYCSNNPVMRTDPTGKAWLNWVTAAICWHPDPVVICAFVAKCIADCVVSSKIQKGEIKSYENMEDLAKDWGKENSKLTKSDHKERGAIILSMKVTGKTLYYTETSLIGYQNTCFNSFVIGYLFHTGEIEGFVHTHPDYYDDVNNRWAPSTSGPSNMDYFLFNLPGIKRQFIANSIGVYEYDENKNTTVLQSFL